MSKRYCSITLPFSTTAELTLYLDRKHINYSSHRVGYFMDTGKLEFETKIEDSEDMRMYKLVQQWLEARAKYLDYCPFCGGIPKIVEDRETYMVSCTECGVKTPWFYNEEVAIGEWNKRFEDEGD